MSLTNIEGNMISAGEIMSDRITGDIIGYLNAKPVSRKDLDALIDNLSDARFLPINHCGDWNCAYCGNLHPPTEYKCDHCGAGRKK